MKENVSASIQRLICVVNKCRSYKFSDVLRNQFFLEKVAWNYDSNVSFERIFSVFKTIFSKRQIRFSLKFWNQFQWKWSSENENEFEGAYRIGTIETDFSLCSVCTYY